MAESSDETGCCSNNGSKDSTDDEGWHSGFKHREPSRGWVHLKAPNKADDGPEKTETDSPHDGTLPWTESGWGIGHGFSLRLHRTDRDVPDSRGGLLPERGWDHRTETILRCSSFPDRAGSSG